VPQAQALDAMLQGQPLIIIDLAVPDHELLQRMQGRRVCGKCATIAEPGSAKQATCDRCGGQMITRADDGDEDVRQHRLEVYARESQPLLDYYRGRATFRSINGAQTPDRVAKDLAAAIDVMVPVASGRS
jgi:adenylate kinase